MIFNTQFLILGFNISLLNSPWHSANAEAFAKWNLYFLQSVLANYCQGKIVLTTFILIFE